MPFLTKNSAILLQGSAIFGEARKNKAEDFTNRVLVADGVGCYYEVVSEQEISPLSALYDSEKLNTNRTAENQFF